tara:strand:+ start:10933 stop:11475 length:543 start_codon:yes stop_codon:yes gene_type:complete
MDKEIKNSVEYISEKSGNKTGFSSPSDYFNNLEEAIAVKLSEENFTKENSFEIPDTYFNKLEDRILANVSSAEKETTIISFKDLVLKMIPITAAASIVLFIGLNSFLFNTTEELTLDDISEDDIAFWLDFSTLTTNEIALALEDDVLDENDFYFSTIKNETIEDYINNSIDYTDLLNENN